MQISDAVCTACGCLCDDIEVTVDGRQIVAAEHACPLGREWFLRGPSALPVATKAGETVPVEQAIEDAAQLLAGARYPLVFGLSHATCEAQRVAIAIADWLGGCVDSVTSIHHGLSGTSFAGVGEVTCTLGEVRHRGDLVIFWGTDPAVSHPRHAERYSLLPPGMFVPGGRADRTCVVVDVRKTETAAAADLFLEIKPGADFEALWVLRALAQQVPLDAEQVAATTGVELAAWQGLLERMKQARFGVVFYGAGLGATRGRYVNADAVMALVRDMNVFTRFVCLPMRGRGNVAGADEALLWATGYPFGVNLSRGYPRFALGEFTAAEVLSCGEPDAALVVGGELVYDLPDAARAHLAAIPTVVLDHGEAAFPYAQIVFRTAPPGLSAAGTMYRTDDVPLPARSLVSAPYPSDVEILAALEARIKQLRRYGRPLVAKERSRRV
ncbi:MAG TPA: formylmethanofuran dehydrogenase subunit B [Pirellulales bacterium]|nr:formylmethanofuran dehydrogenase subunit B [Pirellulales bacterium]